MTEYGLFNDEGCFYGPCYSMSEAETERARFIAEGEEPEDVTIKEMCHGHEGEPKDGCEECFAEYDETEDSDDEEGEGEW